MHHFYCFQPIGLCHHSWKFCFYKVRWLDIKKGGALVLLLLPLVLPLAIHLFKIHYSSTFSLYSYVLLFKVFPVLDTSFHFSSQSYHTVLKCSTLASHSIEQKMQRLFQGFTWFLHSETHTSSTMYSRGADNLKMKRANWYLHTQPGDAAVHRVPVLLQTMQPGHLILPSQSHSILLPSKIPSSIFQKCFSEWEFCGHMQWLNLWPRRQIYNSNTLFFIPYFHPSF